MHPDPKYISLDYLQSYFVDKDDGLPLSGGKVYFFSDDLRTFPKNVYQLNGDPSAYNFVELPNPMVLSSSGTFVDDSGNDISLYAYPYDEQGELELYYIVVKSSSGIEQFTRQAVPFELARLEEHVDEEETSPGHIINYIKNGQFKVINNNLDRNILYDGSQNGGRSGIFFDSFAEGYVFNIYGDQVNIKTDNIFILQNQFSFNSELKIGIMDNMEPYVSSGSELEGNPFYYLKYSSASTSGEIFKYLMYIVSDINAFAGKTITFSVVCHAFVGVGEILNACCAQVYNDQSVSRITASVNQAVLLSGANKLSFDINVPALEDELRSAGGFFIIGLKFPNNIPISLGITNLQLNLKSTAVPEYTYITDAETEASVNRLPTNSAYSIPLSETTVLGYKNACLFGRRGSFLGFEKARLSAAGLGAFAPPYLKWKSPIPTGAVMKMPQAVYNIHNCFPDDTEWLFDVGDSYLRSVPTYSYGDLHLVYSTPNADPSIPKDTVYGSGGNFIASNRNGNVFTVTSNEFGVGHPVSSPTGIGIRIVHPGDSIHVYTISITCFAASGIDAATPIVILPTSDSANSLPYKIYFIIDGYLSIPNENYSSISKRNIYVFLPSTASGVEVAKALYNVFFPLAFNVFPSGTMQEFHMVKT